MRPKILLAAIFILLSAQALLAAGPTITSFSPAQGPVGTLVTITGTSLGSPTAFSIGGVAAIVVSNTGTQLVGLVMPGAATGVVSITAGGGTATSTNKFTITTPSYPHIQQGGALTGTNGLGQPYQGNAVAISADGNTAAVGGYNDNSNQGAVWFYTRSNGTWTQQGAKVTGAGASGGFGAYFGTGVSLSADGNTAAIGGPDDNTGTGAIWIFTRTAGVWTQQGSKLVGTGAIANNGNPEGNAQQGQAVALSADGNTLLEGGWFDNGGIGGAWFFTRTAGVWTQQGSKIVGSNIVGNAYFGRSVALSADGNTASIGGPADNAAWFYTRSGGTWTQSAELTGTGAFGYPVALSADGTTAIIGATGDNAPLGAAWVYTRSGAAWPQANGTKLVGSGGFNYSNGSTEGSAVAISADGNTVVIGGPTDGGNSANGTAGELWVFTRSGGVWTQQGNKFDAGGISSSAEQGSSVAISADGTTLIEGAPQNNTNYGCAAVFIPVLPGVTTDAATNVSATGVNLNGLVSANGVTANVSFEYGTSPTLAGSTVTTTFISGSNPVAANASNVTFASNLTGLTPSTTYYFRIDASDVDGAVQGNILSFTTSAPPPPVITFTGPTYVTYGSTTAPTISSTDPTQPFNYRSGNTNIISITSNGQFQATGVGTTYIVAYQYAAGTTTIEAANSINITVTQAPLTITANNLTVPFGQPIPTLTATYSGFVNGDTPASFTSPLTLYTNAQQGSSAGAWGIFVSQFPVDPNYSFTSVTGTLTITQVFQQPSATTVTQTNVSATGATLNGTANGNGSDATVIIQYTTDDQDGLENLITATLTTGPPTLPGDAGTTNYSAVLTGLQPNTTYYFIIKASNSEFLAIGNVLSFTTPPLPAAQITFGPLAPEVYGSGDVTPGATSTNTSVPITYTSSNTAVATITSGGNIHIVGVGTSQVTASQTGTTITPVTQTFTVTPATLMVTASNTTKVYGSANPGLYYTYSGFVNGDDSTSVTTKPKISTTATASSNAGTYPITVSGAAAAANYTITYVNGTLTVTPAALTIAADNKTKIQGSPNPQLTVTYTGFVNGDTNENLTSPPVVSTVATTNSEVGTYAIAVSGAVDVNYTITYVAGTLTVTPQLVFNPIPAKTYGDPVFNPGATGTNVTYSSGNTSVATITDGGGIQITGAGTTTITASSGESSVPQTLTVNPAPLTISADDQTRPYNTANPTLTVTYSGFVYSDNAASLNTPPTASTTATTTSDVGDYPITVTGAADPNYAITYKPGTIKITKATQTIDFAAIPNQLINDKYDLNNVTASSGLPVTFRLTDPTIATISGTTLTSIQVGNETVTASQPGDGNYLPAPETAQSYSIRDDNGNDVVVNPVVSPNGDGIDDVLNIKGIENYPENKLILVNRNGVMIFEMTNYNNTTRVFDGHSSVTGALQQQGTLLYILEYKVNGDLRRKTGFTVLRY